MAETIPVKTGMPLKPDNISDLNNKRVNSILDTIIAYAQLDFSQKTEISENNDLLDAIGAGVNMLGEELENSTVSLQEKERMLKEIHHRVKNNLQIVSSLLNLQSENIYDEKFNHLIVASRNRINSMALVHEMLYSASDLKRIDFSEYITRLTQNVMASLSKPGADISFTCHIPQHLYFDIDRMIPLGLIMNEIITNSLKYAFPSNEGSITISVQQENGKNIFNISDDGVGLPPGFEADKNSRLGIQLIHMLTSQLGGEITLHHTKGTTYHIILNQHD